MSGPQPRILVTGASGHLGRLVIQSLLEKVKPAQIVAGVRDPSKGVDFEKKGIALRETDYTRPATLRSAFSGIDKLLLISSNSVGQRLPQHEAAITAAKAAGVKLIAYTSILHADTSSMDLAEEHRQTEALLEASGIPHVLLRNGWYTENYTGTIPSALEHGVLVRASGDGKISAAARADYADAAVAVLTAAGNQAGRIYELAGDESFTLAEFAAELSRQAGKTVVYRNLPEAEFKALLVQAAGLPESFAALLAQSDTAAAKGALFDESHTLSKLIGRLTTPLKDVIAAALAS